MTATPKHELRIEAEDGHGGTAAVFLDGEPLYCSKVELTVAAGEVTQAVVTLPFVNVDASALAEVAYTDGDGEPVDAPAVTHIHVAGVDGKAIAREVHRRGAQGSER